MHIHFPIDRSNDRDRTNCEDNDPSKFPPALRPAAYPDEEFVLWQAHRRVADVPSSAASWDVSSGDLIKVVLNHYNPYDPHDPQDNIIRMEDVDWTDRETQVKMWGFAYLRANWSEVEWSTDPEDRKGRWPIPSGKAHEQSC